jgi:hypothetical protein
MHTRHDTFVLVADEKLELRTGAPVGFGCLMEYITTISSQQFHLPGRGPS